MIIKLLRMNRFVSLSHTQARIKASIGGEVPMNDLQFIHDILDYKEIDNEIPALFILR